MTIERRGAVAVVTLTNPPDSYMDSGTVPERDIDCVFHRIETMGKPVTAAINGTAMDD